MTRKTKFDEKIGPASPDFVLDNYILYNLVRTVAIYNDEMAEALRSFDLSILQWRILMLLHDTSPSSVGDLARRSVTKMPTLTRALIRMEEEGFVRRTELEGDRRVVQVTMTPKAVKTLRTVQTIGHRVFERAFEGVNALEIDLVTDVVKRVRDNLRRSPYDLREDQGRSHLSENRKTRVNQ